MNESKKISSGIYLKYHKKLNLSLDDCDKITDFILREYNDLLKEWVEEHSCQDYKENPEIIYITQFIKFLNSK